MPDVRAVPAALVHAADLAGHLSAADCREVRETSGAEPADALKVGVSASRIRTALVQDGRCLAIWGFIDAKTHGVPWMLSAEPQEYAFKAKRKLVETARRDVARALKIWPRLENVAMASNQHHLRLLEVLGFVIKPSGGKFVAFNMEALNV